MNRATLETSLSGLCRYVVVGGEMRLLDDGSSGMPSLKGNHDIEELIGKTKRNVDKWLSRNVEDYVPGWETSHGKFQ